MDTPTTPVFYIGNSPEIELPATGQIIVRGEETLLPDEIAESLLRRSDFVRELSTQGDEEE